MKKYFSILFFSLLFIFSVPAFAVSVDVDNSFLAVDCWGYPLSDEIDYDHIMGSANDSLRDPSIPSSKHLAYFCADYNFEGHTLGFVFASRTEFDPSLCYIYPNGDLSVDQRIHFNVLSTSQFPFAYNSIDRLNAFKFDFTLYYCTVTIPFNHNLSHTRKFFIDIGFNAFAPTEMFSEDNDSRKNYIYCLSTNLLCCYDLGFINQNSFSSGYLLCNNKFLPLSSEDNIVHARIGANSTDNRVRYYGPRDDVKFYFAILYPSSISNPTLVWGGTNYSQNDYLGDSLPDEFSGYRLGFFVGLPMVTSSSYRSFRLIDSNGNSINSAFLYSYSFYNEIYDSELHSIIDSLDDFNTDQNLANTNILNKLNQIYLESVAIHNILDSGGETASEAVSVMEDAAEGNDALIRDSTVNKPSLSYTDPMSSLNTQANGTFTQLMASITSNTTVRKMLLMVSLVALSSYVIFGRK